MRIGKNDIFGFFNYHPSDWHLHMHFKHKLNVSNDIFSVEYVLRKLDTPHFFQTATFPVKCRIPEIADQLFERPKENIKEIKKGYSRRAAQLNKIFLEDSFWNLLISNKKTLL
jgi:hypothetical protein